MSLEAHWYSKDLIYQRGINNADTALGANSSHSRQKNITVRIFFADFHIAHITLPRRAEGGSKILEMQPWFINDMLASTS